MADDLVQRLEELASLRAQGLVSEAEFTVRKAALLAGGAPEAPVASPHQSVGAQSPLDAFEPRKSGGFELAAPLEELEQLQRIGPNAEEDSGGTVVVPPIFEPLPGPPTANPPRVASYELPAAVLPPPPTPSPFVRASVAPSPPGRAGEPYPMVFEVEYPERLSRLTTFFRIVLMLPAWAFISIAGYVFYGAVVAGWTAVFWRKRYPSWLFAAASGYLAYGSRVAAYGALLTDRYPSFEAAESPVRLEYATPPDRQLSRWRVLFWKSVLILPHLFVLQFLAVGVYVAIVLAWFAVLFTGRYPRGLFSFVSGAMRWHLRLAGYFLSFTDRYPPYALSAEAGPASSGTTVASGLLGFAGASVFALLIGVAIAVANDPQVVDADYAQLQQGRGATTATFTDAADDQVQFRLVRIHDPGGAKVPAAKAGARQRVVVFEWAIDNEQLTALPIDLSDFVLTTRGVDVSLKHKALMVLVNGENVPEVINGKSEGGTILAVFVVPSSGEAVSLRVKAAFAGTGGIEYRFE